MKYSTIEKTILREISYYYLAENNRDEEKTLHQLKEMDITGISYNEENKQLKIVIGRPGLLIGSCGKNIINLTTYLQSKIHSDLEIIIEENTTFHYLYGFYHVSDILDDIYGDEVF